ncbi:MOZ/SAS family protein [Coprinopsis cinerea okayama7|uniref:MOZ/SAS family protein n=1 Tax=Coprinopsis cinerea (strain Okayama-7 / 130 / ATCC MYA-4618 / FGSC 9003) TaxID=240176 RepID=A8NLS4_COPC7|nr:MOZ/SAS family protein [Coprinopsis cinerea okayama7\|eukprot:XP_001834764.2 MOZ/SAS family protein [Coprinopsis cinerea okayama7\
MTTFSSRRNVRPSAVDLFTGLYSGNPSFKLDRLWESCLVENPPGKIVYNKNPNRIWEVDGASRQVRVALLSFLFIDMSRPVISFTVKIYPCLANCSLTKKPYSSTSTIASLLYCPLSNHETIQLADCLLSSSRKKPLKMAIISLALQCFLRTSVKDWEPCSLNLMRSGPSLIGTTIQRSPATSESRSWCVDQDLASRYRLDVILPGIHREFSAGRDGPHVNIRCTLADIAKGANLEVQDTLFALNECGLLTRRMEVNQTVEEIVITSDMVEKVARERGVKPMRIDLHHVYV